MKGGGGGKVVGMGVGLPGVGSFGDDFFVDDSCLVRTLRELLETLPRKKESEAKMLLAGDKPFVRPCKFRGTTPVLICCSESFLGVFFLFSSFA